MTIEFVVCRSSTVLTAVAKSPRLLLPVRIAAVRRRAWLQEETLWRGRPSAVILVGHVFMMLIVLIGVPLLAGFIASKTNDLDTVSRINHIGWLVTLVVLVIQLFNFLIALARLQGTFYTITNQRVMIERGILSKSLSEIDLRYIDETEFFQRFMDRLLGVGNVVLISSDKVFPQTTLQNIKDPRGVRELIRSHAYQASQRQLFTRAT